MRLDQRIMWSQRALLLVLAVVIALARVAFLNDLPDWDTATYNLIGREVALAGKWLYSDIWDMKPPGVFAAYGLGQIAARGDWRAATWFVSTLASVGTLVALYFAARSIRDRRTGVWAALLWTAVCAQPGFEAHFANTEAFINLFLAAGIALMLRAEVESDFHRAARLGCTGACFALATMFKHVAIVPMAAFVAAHVLSAADRPMRRRRLAEGAVVLACVPLGWAVLAGYFAVTGRWQVFIDTNFVYARHYAGSIGANLLAAVRPTRLFPVPIVFELLPLIVLAIVGIAIASRMRVVLIGLCAGAFVAVAMPGQFFAHYYQLWFVPLVLAGAVGAAWLQTVQLPAAARALQNLVRFVPALAFVGLIWLQLHWFTASPEERATLHSPASFVLDVARGGRELAKMLKPGETVFVWADEPQLYLLTDRRPPAAALWKMHTTQGPMASTLTEHTLADLDRAPPTCIVLWGMYPGPEEHPIYRWIRDRGYRPVDGGERLLPLMVLRR